MKRRTFIASIMSPVALAACGGKTALITSNEAPSPSDTRALALDAMKRAAIFMDEKVSYRGGYVWSYLPDMSTTWGEMEAKRSMCWIQPPSTPTVAHCFLDAYHATGDEVFYKAAERTASALIQAQHPSGGWNYVYDFEGEEALKKWYDTTAKNGWRLEEFHHYYGNATFDDAGTASCSQFLLRMYLEKGDPLFLAPLNKAIDFVVKSQYSDGIANGGWPQRYPPSPASITSMPVPNPSLLPSGATYGMEDGDYTTHVTFNDDVASENIKFLLMCIMGLGETRLIGNVTRAMECVRVMQQPAPQAGWGLQHLEKVTNGRPAGAPSGARSYEPRGLTTHTTQANVQQLFHFFRLTGDKKYLARVPEAIAWLNSCPLPPDALTINPLLVRRTHPTFIELGTNQPRYVHRYGSNVRNGAYYFDKDIRNTLGHYSAGRNINTGNLQKTYDQLMSMTPAAVVEMTSRSPLNAIKIKSSAASAATLLPRYFSLKKIDFPDLLIGQTTTTPSSATEEEVKKLATDLGTKNYWLNPITNISNPYRGDGPTTPHAGKEYMSKSVGDIYDTSPYDPLDPPVIAPYEKKDRPLGITTAGFVSNMNKLIAFVATTK